MSTQIDKFSLHVAQRLVEERERLFGSQAEAGVACAVSRVMWGQYERGQAAPGGAVWLKLAEAGADVQYILTGQRSTPTLQAAQASAGYSVEVLSPEEQALIDNYRHAPADGRSALETTSAALAKSGSKRKAG